MAGIGVGHDNRWQRRGSIRAMQLKITRLSLVLIAFLIGCAPPSRFRDTVNNPGEDFVRVTGLEWPSGAKVVRVGDTHGGFNGDGEFYLVFDVDKAMLANWLGTNPPWGGNKWNKGPVPGEIGFHCNFGSSERIYTSNQGSGPSQYGGDPQLVALLSSEKVLYVARERGAGSIRWHNGDLLVVDSDAGRVWLSVWDF